MKTCNTCKHIGLDEECPVLLDAVYVASKHHGWDGWTEVTGLEINEPEKFSCALYEAKT